MKEKLEEMWNYNEWPDVDLEGNIISKSTTTKAPLKEAVQNPFKAEVCKKCGKVGPENEVKSRKSAMFKKNSGLETLTEKANIGRFTSEDVYEFLRDVFGDTSIEDLEDDSFVKFYQAKEKDVKGFGELFSAYFDTHFTPREILDLCRAFGNIEKRVPRSWFGTSIDNAALMKIVNQSMLDRILAILNKDSGLETLTEDNEFDKSHFNPNMLTEAEDEVDINSQVKAALDSIQPENEDEELDTHAVIDAVLAYFGDEDSIAYIKSVIAPECVDGEEAVEETDELAECSKSGLFEGKKLKKKVKSLRK